MVYDCKLLNNFIPLLYSRLIKCAGGATLPITGYGDLTNGYGRAYLVPSAKVNLLSISQLTASGNEVSFTKHNVYLNNKLIGHLDSKLYILRSTMSHVPYTTNTDPANVLATFAHDVLLSSEDSAEKEVLDYNLSRDLDLLHRRFAHTDVNMLLRMVRLNSVDGLHIPAHVAD